MSEQPNMPADENDQREPYQQPAEQQSGYGHYQYSPTAPGLHPYGQSPWLTAPPPPPPARTRRDRRARRVGQIAAAVLAAAAIATAGGVVGADLAGNHATSSTHAKGTRSGASAHAGHHRRAAAPSGTASPGSAAPGRASS